MASVAGCSREPEPPARMMPLRGLDIFFKGILEINVSFQDGPSQAPTRPIEAACRASINTHLRGGLKLGSCRQYSPAGNGLQLGLGATQL